jgi:hypothetical protein
MLIHEGAPWGTALPIFTELGPSALLVFIRHAVAMITYLVYRIGARPC